MFNKLFKILYGEELNENENQKVESNKKVVITNTDEIKEIESSSEKPQPTKEIFNANYNLPNVNLIDNEIYKNFVKENLNKDEIMIPIGISDGELYSESIQSMPSLLIGGYVGTGKSNFIHTIISTILMTKKPHEVKLVLIDTKGIELSIYNGVPHLLCPVINDCNRASLVLEKIVVEMNNRYSIFSKYNVRSIDDYNIYVEKENVNSDKDLAKMPYIVIIIDELAELMNKTHQKSEDSIFRITQMARVAGIHIIMSSNMPSKDIMSDYIKSNIPARLCFKVTNEKDSKFWLDEPGAEKLSINGYALYKSRCLDQTQNVISLIINKNNLESIIDYVCNEQKVQYNEEYVDLNNNAFTDGGDDPLYDEIVEFAIYTGKVSASLLQRRFRLGYNRAARLVDILEERGIIGPQVGSKPREVLIKFESKK